MRQRARVDTTHAEIVTALRKAGYSVQSLAAVGKGVPDLLVGRWGKNILLEVKGPKGELTPDQQEWLALWPGPWAVVRSIEDALNVMMRHA